MEIAGYYFFGLVGLGGAFLLTYLIYSIQVYLIARKRYGFRFSSSFKNVFAVLFIIVLISFVIAHTMNSMWAYLIQMLLFLGCSYYALRELNRRMDLVQVINNRINKKNQI